MTAESDGLEFGPMDQESSEVELVLDSMSKSFRASPYAGVVPNHLWHPVIKAAYTGLLERGAKVLCARAAGRVVGYFLYEEKGPDLVAHYVYVKDYARRTGVAKRLLERAGATPGRRVFYSFRTKATPWLTRGLTCIHAPETARRKEL
jgi:hypothetical protein